MSAHREIVREAREVFECATDEEFNGWMRAGKETINETVEGIRQQFCEDCMPWYEERMDAEGLCWKRSVLASDSVSSVAS